MQSMPRNATTTDLDQARSRSLEPCSIGRRIAKSSPTRRNIRLESPRRRTRTSVRVGKIKCESASHDLSLCFCRVVIFGVVAVLLGFIGLVQDHSQKILVAKFLVTAFCASSKLVARREQPARNAIPRGLPSTCASDTGKHWRRIDDHPVEHRRHNLQQLLQSLTRCQFPGTGHFGSSGIKHRFSCPPCCTISSRRASLRRYSVRPGPLGAPSAKCNRGTAHVRVYQQDAAVWLANDDLRQVARNKRLAFGGQCARHEDLFSARASREFDIAESAASEAVPCRVLLLRRERTGQCLVLVSIWVWRKAQPSFIPDEFTRGIKCPWQGLRRCERGRRRYGDCLFFQVTPPRCGRLFERRCSCAFFSAS